MKHYKLLLIVLVVLAAAVPVLTKRSGGSEEPATTGGAEGQEVVAYLHGEPIYAEEVDARILAQILKLKQQIYENRKNALKTLVDERLMEEEATNRGITTDQLYNAEVLDKVGAITAEDVEKFYNAFRSDAAIRGKSLEEAEPIIRKSLRQKRLTDAEEGLLQALYATANYKVAMRPPRVDVPVPDGEPSKGPEDAPITIVEFSDFQCGFCKRVEKTVDQLFVEYPGQIRVIYRDFPLRNHNRATPAAIAARCAGDQDKYWEYHENLFEVSGSLSDEDLLDRAETVGLDMDVFSECVESQAHADAVKLSFAHGSMVGVKGTPTFFINGRQIAGAKPLADFKAIIDEELELSDGG